MGNEELTNMHIAVYAVSLLGGSHQKVHTEHVANKCLEVAPDRFKWEHFNYPDKELVRKALFHASEKKNGALVIGRSGIEQRGKSRDGWQLTPAGARWLREHELALRIVTGSQSKGIPKREAERLVKQIRQQEAFQRFSKKGNLAEVSPYMFTDMLNCSPDASIEIIGKKFNRLFSNALLVNDDSIIQFLRACERQFGHLLGSTSGST